MSLSFFFGQPGDKGAFPALGSLLLFWLPQSSWESAMGCLCVLSGSPGDAELLRPCLMHTELLELSSLWVGDPKIPALEGFHLSLDGIFILSQGRMDQGRGTMRAMLP